ncbi:MAG: Hint domain-containing protein [Methanomicrobiales archaeon]|nr:Hint domain-containing protein [Methanomicrobiales archaeon]
MELKLFPVLFILSLAISSGCLAPPGPVQTYTLPQLKYLLLDHYGESEFFFCDPDYYPISRGDELEKALEYFPIIQNNTDEFTAITDRKGLNPPYSDEVKLTIYREYKKLRAIPLSLAGESSYEYTMQLGIEGDSGRRVTGSIHSDGTILEQRSENVILTCPICLDENTVIDTPRGPIPVDELREGMMVWTLDTQGDRRPLPILSASCSAVPSDHRVIRLQLSDGREVNVSPGHPTTDNRTIGMLMVGDMLDRATITRVDLIAYDKPSVCDILPAGDTKSYWANGILLKSSIPF